MNTLGRPEKIVSLPAYRKICVADDNDRKTLEKFEKEARMDIYLEPDNGRDYFVSNVDGSITRVAVCANINGTQWIIPAQQRTKIPKSVYEFLIQCEETARRVKLPHRSQCLGMIS